MRVEIENMMGGSRSAREAAQRKLERGLRSILVRMRRGGFTFVGLFAALVVYMIVYGGVGFFTFLLAMFAIFLLSITALFLPVRDRSRPDWIEGRAVEPGKPVPLGGLASQTQDWLLRRCRQLPREAGPTLDRIVDRLRDLEPSLATVPADSAIGGEAQRLIGQHIPNLVETYLHLPEAERGAASVQSGRLGESLAIVADHLDDLCERIAEERRMGFDTERRFIETRYRDTDLDTDRRG